MTVIRDINGFLENPEELLRKKPFTRGGELTNPTVAKNISLTDRNRASFGELRMDEITQDTYLQEYDPSMHRIKFNQSIPHISVKIGGRTISIDELTLTEAFQKNIHAAHVLHLATNPMKFVLCNQVVDEAINAKFSEYKQEWAWRNMEKVKYDAISKLKKVGDVGMLFSFDSKTSKGHVRTYSYDDGYIVIPNYDEYGEKIACTLYHKDEEGNSILDTYDNTNHYNINFGVTDDAGKPTITTSKHGYSICPLLYKRGRVAWEYGESIIEMIELMLNINAVALKRFGTFGLVLIGEMDANSFKKDSSTLIINLSADSGNGKQDAKTLTFPEPQKMIEYLEYLVKQLQIACSVTFITPDSLKIGGDIGGNAVQLAMKNDLALATQSVLDWSDFTNDMAMLFGEMLGLESKESAKYSEMKIRATLDVWTPESKSSLINNLSYESKWLSKRSVVENSPHAAPDEMDRIGNETKNTADKINATGSNTEADVSASADEDIKSTEDKMSLDSKTDVIE